MKIRVISRHPTCILMQIFSLVTRMSLKKKKKQNRIWSNFTHCVLGLILIGILETWKRLRATFEKLDRGICAAAPGHARALQRQVLSGAAVLLRSRRPARGFCLPGASRAQKPFYSFHLRPQPLGSAVVSQTFSGSNVEPGPPLPCARTG